MSNTQYDRLKFVAQILLPALGTLYFTLAGIWGLPAAEQVVGTIVAADTFLGVLLHLSTVKYNTDAVSGALNVQEAGGKKIFSLELDGDPEELEKKDAVTFKVVKPKK